MTDHYKIGFLRFPYRIVAGNIEFHAKKNGEEQSQVLYSWAEVRAFMAEHSGSIEIFVRPSSDV